MSPSTPSSISSDTTLFRAERLAEFDAVLFNNNTGEPFTDPDLRASLLAFVRGGGGVIGLHAATDGFHEWPEFGEMMGGYFVGHPWNEEVTLKIEDPGHPITASFSTARYVVADEIYQFREPYSRDRLRVLISLDTVDLDLEREGVQRGDRDFAVSWIREEGEGRARCCARGRPRKRGPDSSPGAPARCGRGWWSRAGEWRKGSGGKMSRC